jgi:hypothetical protein
MAADVTASKAAHFEVVATGATKLNLTGAGRYVDIVGHSHGSHNDVYFTVASSEADLAAATVEGDDTLLCHNNERIRIPVPHNTWMSIIGTATMDVSVMKVNTLY